MVLCLGVINYCDVWEPVLTLLRLGGAHCAPYRFLPFCAKTVCSRLMKLCDFEYNKIGHHLKQFSVDSNLRCCHGNAFVKERLAEIVRLS